MTSLKPLTVFGHWGAPNPWKVRIILEELEIPHEWREVEFSDVKSKEYLSITPNGRLPAIQDPNTGVTLWEVRQFPLFPWFSMLGWSHGLTNCVVRRNHPLPDRRVRQGRKALIQDRAREVSLAAVVDVPGLGYARPFQLHSVLGMRKTAHLTYGLRPGALLWSSDLVRALPS